MPASSRGRHAMQEAVVLVMPTICSRCATGWTRSPPRRVYSSGITPQTSVDGSSADIDGFGAVAGPVQQRPTATAAAYDVRSGLMVSRPPLLTRELHPFESAFFFYQKRLAERLNTSFVTSIYYKRQTTRLMEWNVKVKERKGAVAKELGPYHGKGSRAWDDELRVGDPLSSQEHLLDSLLKDAETRVSDEAELIPAEDVVPVPRPMPRETEADRQNDVRRLDRKLDKTLYLVLKGRDGQWGFPVDLVAENENLHEAAQRILDQSAGVNMNTWIVGRTPIAHMVDKAVYSADGAVEKHGLKTFFLKARIMAGQANLARNQLGYSDFKWLTRDELESELSSEYYRAVSKALSAR